MRFVAVGELLVDVVAEGSGHAARIRARPGGSAFTAAAAAAAAGADATVIGTVGDDPAGRMILSELGARGVHVEVAVSDGPTGTFLVAGGEVFVDRGVSGAIVLPDAIEADAVLVSGHLPRGAIEAALGRARAPWIALDAARLGELPAGGNVLLANEDAARRLTGEEPDEAVRALAGGRRLACVTLGARGAIAALDGKVERFTPPSVAADSPGTGDVFAAAFLVALAREEELAAGLRAAGQAVLDSLR